MPFLPSDEASRILAAIVESSEDAIIAKDRGGDPQLESGGRADVRVFGRQIIGSKHHRVPIGDYRWRNWRASCGALPPAARSTLRDRPVAKAGDRRGVSDDPRLFATRRARSQRPQRSPGTPPNRTARSRNSETAKPALRSVIESAVDGIIVIDAAGIVEAFNPGAERLFGYRASEVIGRNVNLLMPSPYHEEHDGYLARYLRTGEARIIGIGREVTAQRKDGSTFPVQLSVGEMSVAGGRKFTGIIHDLSARVRVEAQLREQAALVRLGEMAAVIAHEVKNPLAAVRGAIQVIGKRLPAGSREVSVVTDIIARIDTLNALVKDLLLFARPPQPKPMAIDVVTLLSTTATLLAEDAAHNGVRITISGTAPKIMADA
jgi:PAS domain S-box-containing protein